MSITIFGETKISSKDRILHRTGDQTLEVAPRTGYNSLWLCRRWRERLEEVPKTVSQSSPDPVLPEQIAVTIRGLSWLIIEAVMTSSQDQNFQRTVEQSIGDKLHEAMSHVLEIVEIRQHTVEQDFVEVDKGIPQERTSERMGKQSRSIEVPKISFRKSVEAGNSIPQKRCPEQRNVNRARSSRLRPQAKLRLGGVQWSRLSVTPGMSLNRFL